jgi:hypothetical protein
VDGSLSFNLVYLVGTVGLIGCASFIFLFAHELTERLMGPMANRRSGATPARQRTVSWLWTSPLPAATAVLTAIATVPLSAPIITRWLTEGGLWFAVVPAVFALAGAAWSAVALTRRSRNGASSATRPLRTDILAVAIWMLAMVVMLPVVPMLIDTGGRSITDMTVVALVLVPCPAWILLRRSNQRSTETALG